MKLLRKYADNSRSDSIVNKWRRKRFAAFLTLIADLPRPVRILDVGGTENFWIQMGFTDNTLADITILNIEPINTTYKNFKFIKGDATDLGRFKDNEFDVVFSNSVIEHVGDISARRKMAAEIHRTGKRYFVQTPNYFFPIEPHFLFPFFQFLPHIIQIYLVMHFRLGWFVKSRSKLEAVELINSIHLLKKREVEELFPDGRIIKEKFLFITKSFMALSVKRFG